ncbi:SusD/RagB family nutrient-binding outer membrane lipoprotein [Flavitalea flava]
MHNLQDMNKQHNRPFTYRRKSPFNYTNGFFIFLTAMLLSASCKKVTDINTDPTKSTNMDPAKQVALIQVRFSGELTVNERLGIILTMPLVQQIGGIWENRYGQMYIENKQYQYDFWETTYPNDVLNIVDAVNRTKGDAGRTNLNAIARIMKVVVFGRLTDVYGDIPYSEAGAAFSNGVVRPKYDSQESIYTDFFKELNEAATALDISKDPLDNDLFYNGNIAEWKKFAHTLHLRLAMRLVKVNPELAKKEALAAFSDGVFTSNDDICMLSHQDVQNAYDDIRGNGVSVALNQQEVLPRANNTLVNALKNTNDPRLNYLIRCYQDKSYQPFNRIDITDQVKAQVGVFGVNKGSYIWDDWANSFNISIPGAAAYTVSNNEQKAQLANFLIRNNAPFFHLTYAETEFLLAEASIRWPGEFGGTADAHYAAGITAACKQLSYFPEGPALSDNEIGTFIQGNPLQPGKEIELINTQLWIALLLNGPEAFANWRRTGYPKFVPAITSESTTTSIPRRFEYPLSEHEQNSANIATAIQALGGQDDWNGRVWWDKE